MTKDQILTEAMALNAQDRDKLAEAIWQSMAPDEFTPGQIAEVRRRMAALDCGEVQPIPGEQVMRELRRRFQ